MIVLCSVLSIFISIGISSVESACTTTTTTTTTTTPTTTPPWYQWLGYDCSSAGGTLIATFNNVPTGVYTSGNCFLKCYADTNCWYFVWNSISKKKFISTQNTNINLI